MVFTCSVPPGGSEPEGPFPHDDYAPLIRRSEDPTENEAPRWKETREKPWVNRQSYNLKLIFNLKAQ